MSTETTQRAASWLAEGFECLAERLGAAPTRAGVDFDVVVVGSGYGGAVAASALAGCRLPDGRALTVCVLERGREYLPGAFPARMADLPGHVRFATDTTSGARGEREGLFDIKVGGDVSALVANGLGGGSLINAGVMVEPGAAARAALEALTGPLDDYYRRARAMLGAERDRAPNTILAHASGVTPRKYIALQSLARRLGHEGNCTAAPLTVAMRRHRNDAGVTLDACKLCGDCATGCNFNAKASLDTNLLVKARRQGAQLFTGATVVRIARDGAGPDARWRLHVELTDAGMRKRLPDGFTLHANKVILAAGTYGSTEILLHSRTHDLSLSAMLGEKFSSNGDMIAVAYGQREPVDAVADENDAPGARQVGPTITGLIRVPGAAGELLVEELAVPGPMRRVFEEIVATSAALHALGRPDRSTHGAHDAGHDPCAVDGHAMRHSAVLAVMGDDGAAGRMQLVGRPGQCDGGLRVDWPELRRHRLFTEQAALLAAGGAQGPDGAAANGTILPNPLWKLLPDDMAYLLKGRRGPLLTVHPLGGCAMGASALDGVVNQYGQVFRDPAGSAVHDTLMVLDGAIVPLALGVNPALTIAALALRAVEQLRRDWQLDASSAGAGRVALGPRPVFQARPDVAAAPAPTVVQFVERLSGPVTLHDRAGMARTCMVELTLRFDPCRLGALFLPRGTDPVPQRRVLHVGAESDVAVYDLDAWRSWRRMHEGSDAPRPDALVRANVTGTLDLFQREDSTRLRRVARTLVPWLRHRGLRDTWQWLFDGAEQAPAGAADPAETWPGRLRNALALASHAGEVRRFDYRLVAVNARGSTQRSAQIEAQAGAGLDPAAFEGAAIAGAKRLTYGYGANPWSQLMTMTLGAFPCLPARAAPALELDTGFLIRENVPLMRVMAQQDQPTALGDLAGLAGYLLRLLLSIHMWSFRKPDTPPARLPQRLPPELPGLQMERIWLPFPDLPAFGALPPRPVSALLTRYRGAVDAALPPVLMIHGYSASGTTYAHALVQPNLAGYMCAQGRDVWVLDMRTSSGMETATHPWEFEDAAHNDIPVAVARVCQATGHHKIDVVAHCMGAAMIGMAVLGRPGNDAPYRQERRELPGRINRLVLSQVGPLVVFSQANIFRAYLMGYVRHLLPNVKLPFRVEGAPGLADELLDRLLATVPYPDAEFRIENPPWPWQRAHFAGTRHRMDALYGRDFQLANIDPAILEHIDDFFGPYNLVTLNQAIHFARLKTITNRIGRNPYVSRRTLKEAWTFPTHSIHGTENGLADVSTLGRMAAILQDAGCRFSQQAFEGYGHQDCLIGRGAVKVFENIDAFLGGRLDAVPAGAEPAPAAQAGIGATMAGAPMPPPPQLIARVPWSGPVRSGLARQPGITGIERTPVGAAASPAMHQADYIAMVPVVLQGERYAFFNPDGATKPADILIDHVELFITPGAADADGWIQLSARTPPPGADGVMMLMLYDASGGLEPPPEKGLPLRRRTELMALLEGYNPALLVASELQEWIYSLTAPVYEAIHATLTRTPARALRSAVIGSGSAAPPAARTTEPSAAPGPPGEVPEGPDATLCFAVGSCQYPSGLLDSVPAFASYARLAARLDAAGPGPTPAFLALLGDQIYADATAGLFDPSALDDRYVRPYEKLLCNEMVKDVRRRLPTVSMLDDHEIADNWEPRQDGTADPDMAEGVRAYLKFQRTADLVPDDAPGPVHPGERLAFAFDAGGAHFYMADTRTGRDARTPFNAASAAIMRPEWFSHLLGWLLQQHRADPAAPKFIATPSILAPGRIGAGTFANDARCLRYDGWAGYPASFRQLLAFIAEHAIGNVVLLSGDEHISCDAVLRIGRPGVPQVAIRAIHSSALYAPYPFANSSAADMADAHYKFTFASPGDTQEGYTGEYACDVRTAYVPGDGFAIVSATRDGGTWRVDCEFDRATGPVRTTVADLPDPDPAPAAALPEATLEPLREDAPE